MIQLVTVDALPEHDIAAGTEIGSIASIHTLVASVPLWIVEPLRDEERARTHDVMRNRRSLHFALARPADLLGSLADHPVAELDESRLSTRPSPPPPPPS